MPNYLKAASIIILTFLASNVFAQLNVLFTPYNCQEADEALSVVTIEFEPIFIDSTLLIAEYPYPSTDTVGEWRQWNFIENFAFGVNRGTMPMINDLMALHTYFRDRIIELIKVCKSKGIKLAIVETYRTHAKQNEYKGMGKKYTNSVGGKSKHQYGLAIDVVPMVNNKPAWNNTALWRKVGAAGENLGLRWGGRWRKPYDPAHFEWTGGLSASELAHGSFPEIPQCNEKYPCLKEDIERLRTYWKEWETEQSSMTRR